MVHNIQEFIINGDFINIQKIFWIFIGLFFIITIINSVLNSNNNSTRKNKKMENILKGIAKKTIDE
tara:strand:- start:17 stop:214 length:198 start_codon:yes stop_codon:yes gene_type:complete